MKNEDQNELAPALVSVNRQAFFQVTALLAVLLLAAIGITYLVPRGDFGTLPGGETDYTQYIPRPDRSGIPVFRGLLAPVLVFFSDGGLTLTMLSLFLFVISAAFQVMNDVGGVDALVGAVAERFRQRKRLLLVLLSFLFYCFGSFLGLFEEMLTMLPIAAALCVTLGYDAFTGFLCSIIACGFGFAGAVTNPFTVLLASQIIGVNPMEHVWLRLVIFAVMFVLFAGYLLFWLCRLEKNPERRLTKAPNALMRSGVHAAPAEARRARKVYGVFLLAALGLMIVSSLSDALRDYSVVLLIAYFLVFGILAGILAGGGTKAVLRSFGRGFLGALPTLVFIALAASIKFVFDEGGVMPSIVRQINVLAEGRSPFGVALAVYVIVLVLEFFISSSTAKAILVMGLLSVVNIGLSKPLLVLLYTFGDGYTNVVFPTSPVLLISLSMIQMDYFTWVKKSLPLFVLNFLLVIAFIALAVAVGY